MALWFATKPFPNPRAAQCTNGPFGSARNYRNLPWLIETTNQGDFNVMIPAVILACALATPVAMAQNTAPNPSAAAAPVAAAGQLRASKLVGVNIYNEQNDMIGEIDNVIIDGSGWTVL
jgi:hypothetical protein